MEKVPSEVAYDRWHMCEQFTNLSQIRGVLPDKALAEFFSFFLGEKKDVSGALQKQNARPLCGRSFSLVNVPSKDTRNFLLVVYSMLFSVSKPSWVFILNSYCLRSNDGHSLSKSFGLQHHGQITY
jgi:hypothetical protein